MNKFERTGSSGPSLLDGKNAEPQKASSLDVTDNAPASAREGQSATPLYDQLVAGRFNSLHWKQFAEMCVRITQEENVPWTDIREYILVWIDANETIQEGCIDDAMTATEGNGNTVLYRAVRKSLKNMPLDDAERQAFEEWQSDSQHQAGKGSNGREPGVLQVVHNWLSFVYDMLDGKYVIANDEKDRQLDSAYGAALHELKKMDCFPLRKDKLRIARQATEHLAEVFMLHSGIMILGNEGMTLDERIVARKRWLKRLKRSPLIIPRKTPPRSV